ncbi:Uncharacterised protein [Raoultella terrigena]|uniref:Uncharacterized protein n=1 Tax=Raoultella terrigena TaxID=577 RepID=A0A4V6J2M9_RAOTE|nr:Uncharacterised protein [Raoultella terrigena]
MIPISAIILRNRITIHIFKCSRDVMILQCIFYSVIDFLDRTFLFLIKFINRFVVLLTRFIFWRLRST